MLDNSIVLFGSNMSNSNLHDHFPLPTAIVGGGCGKVKGNQHLRYPDRTPIANMHVALLNRVGVSTEKFGDSTGRVHGDLMASGGSEHLAAALLVLLAPLRCATRRRPRRCSTPRAISSTSARCS